MDRPIYDFVLGNDYNKSKPHHKGKREACGVVYRERAKLRHGDVSDKHGGSKEAHCMTNGREMYKVGLSRIVINRDRLSLQQNSV